MEINLNVYNNNGEIEKTYKAEEFDLMWGTIEDLCNVIDLDKIHDNVAVGKMVLSLLPQLKPLLKQIFKGVTDDEIKRTKVKELIPIFIEVFTYAFKEFATLGGGKSGN